jgi:hypothetical protein
LGKWYCIPNEDKYEGPDGVYHTDISALKLSTSLGVKAAADGMAARRSM